MEPRRLVQVDIAPRQALQLARGFLGEVRFGLWTNSDQDKLLECGWLFMDGGTIGSPASGATARAAEDCYELFEHLWNRTTNTELAIQTSAGAGTTRGASALADWAANKRLPLPAGAGVSPLGKKASGTASALGAVGGSVDITVKKHYHGMGTGADLNITSSGSETHAHLMASTNDSNNVALTGSTTLSSKHVGSSESYTFAGSSQAAALGLTGAAAAPHTHASDKFAGRVGIVTGGVDGNADQAASSPAPYFACQYIIAF